MKHNCQTQIHNHENKRVRQKYTCRTISNCSPKWIIGNVNVTMTDCNKLWQILIIVIYRKCWDLTMIEHFLPISVKGDKRFMRKFDSTVKYYFRGGLPSLYPDRLRNAVKKKHNAWKVHFCLLRQHILPQTVVLQVILIFSYLYSTGCFCICGFAVLGRHHFGTFGHNCQTTTAALERKQQYAKTFREKTKQVLNIATGETSQEAIIPFHISR